MNDIEALKAAIEARDTKAILRLMFRGQGPELQDGFHREDQWWDFKLELPPPSKSAEIEWAKVAADVLAFHNQDGGVILFGVRNSDFRFVGARPHVDTKQFNDKIRKYVGDQFWVSFSREFIQADQTYLGIAIVPPKAHSHQRMLRDSPVVQGRPLFRKGDLCIRIGDETRILRGSEAIQFTATHGLGASAAAFVIDESNFRILRPDYKHFITRAIHCDEIEKALISNRTYVTSLTGIGGVGKTALACWVTLLAYERRLFDFIVSVSARDRALTLGGIIATVPTLSSLEDLLTQVCEVTGFGEYTDLDFADKARRVRDDILSQFRGLLLIDNLETVDDPRLIEFLEDLPVPTKAIVTSRKAKIRVANYPVEIGPFGEDEAIRFLGELSRTAGKDFLDEMQAAEKKILADACDRIPLVIEWFLGRVHDAEKALALAEKVTREARHGEELLEFSFRRVYEEMTEGQRGILHVLSLVNRPLPIEAVAVGANLDVHRTADVLEELKDYSLVERIFDEGYRDLVYSMLPVTSSFIYRQLAKMRGREGEIRKRLADWYEARDIRDWTQRQLVQKVRRGERNPELALLEVARNFAHSRRLDEAEQFYKQALERNPRSWQCHREIAEFYRHQRGELALCLRHYQQAAEFAPKQGPDRALIFREWGIVLRDSGMPGSLRDAADKLSIALKETPHSLICRHALGDCYVKLSAFDLAIETLKPLEDHPTRDTRVKTRALLETCYRATGRTAELLQLRDKIRREEA